ncbi:autotransporter outer membrane beta-barrel domain-containing protein [Sneathiella glossodoripedis]|uniref:autotransporter outer membrane beta-barrel domain-containing protein n=1 Tax=Sneathiella glossodoripedis TaxID=418853 RepID=UPI0004701B52|nr:autotransporter outer membrane beta-barrel domain-containing protein [Sneathiella glossodoripedis]
MRSIARSKNLKKSLLGGISVIAFVVAIGNLQFAHAAVNDADASTDTNNGATVTSTDTNGLLNDDAIDHIITIDSAAGAITLGVTATTDAITFNSQAGVQTATYNVTTSGTNNSVTFAGDVHVKGNENIEINVTNTTTIFQGDVQVSTGSTTITIGNGSSNLTTTFDTATAGSNSIDATINANAAGDIVMLQISNTDGTATNEIVFEQNVGGVTSTTTIDNIQIATGANATFNGTVLAGTISHQSTGETTFNDTVTGNINITADGTITLEDTAAVTGNIDNTSGTDGVGTLSVEDQVTGAITAVSGNIGATNSLKEVNVNSTSNAVTFGGTVNAATINLTGAADTDETIFQDDVTGAIVINTTGLATFEADKKLVGSITTNTDGQGLVEFETATTDTTLVSGAVGTSGGNALKEVIVNSGVGVTSTFGSTVDANAVTINGTGVVAFTDDVTASTGVSFGGDASVTFTANKKVIGNVDATANQGTLIFSPTTEATVLVSGDVGGTNALSEVRTSVATGITATLAGDVNADTVRNNGLGTLGLSGDVTGDLELSAGGIMALAATKTLTGNIDNTSGSDGSGTFTAGAIGGNLTVVSGTIGATNSLAQVTVDTTGGAATFSGAVNATNITATGTGTTVLGNGGNIENITASGDFSSGASVLNIGGDVTITGGSLLAGAGGLDFDGTAAQTISGEVDGTNALTISNAHASGVTFEDAAGSTTALGAITIGSGSLGNFESTVSAASIDLDGEIEVNDTVTLSGNIDINNATITLGTDIGNSDTAFVVADVTSSGTSTIRVSRSFTSGTIVVFDSAADASSDLANLTVQDTALVDYSLSANGNDIELSAVAKSLTSTAAELGISMQEARSLVNAELAIASGNDALLTNFSAALNAGGAAAKKAAQSAGTQPDTLGASTNITISLGNRAIGISSERLSSQRDSGPVQSEMARGFSAGSNPANKNAWIKTFGSYGEQDDESSVDGYDATTYGVSFGYDKRIADEYRLGASFTYSATDVDGNGAGESKNDISSYQGTIYGDFTSKNYYAEAAIGFAYNSHEASRVIDFLGTDTTASADYDSYQFTASMQTGFPIKLNSVAYFTPTAGLAWTYLSTDSYTETGAGGLNQRVDIDDMHVLLGTLGGRFHTHIKTARGFLVPEIRGGVSYDFIGDSAVATATYTGGGSAYKVESQDPDQFGANIGLGLTYDSGSWLLGGSYDADIKSSYLSHSAKLKATLRF